MASIKSCDFRILASKALLCAMIFGFSIQAFSADDSLVKDAFDPFADYSDFVAASTEETDVNFFKYGRMLSVGVILGHRRFTGSQSEVFGSDTYYGFSFTYYLSLQFAFKLSYLQGSGDYRAYEVRNGTTIIDASGEVLHKFYSLHGKYFINTQNLTKTISKYNPYLIGGFSLVERESSLNTQLNEYSGDEANSIDFGAGLEYLFANNKYYISFQAMYHYTSFPDENKYLQSGSSSTSSNLRLKGDILQFHIELGANF